MRTTANILQRGLKEVNLAHTLDDGRIVHPLRNIGYKRLFGLGTTVVAIPYGTVEAAKAIYDVTEDEMKALTLKKFGEYKVVGKSIPALDIPDKLTGVARYGIDVFVPNIPGLSTAAQYEIIIKDELFLKKAEMYKLAGGVRERDKFFFFW